MNPKQKNAIWILCGFFAVTIIVGAMFIRFAGDRVAGGLSPLKSNLRGIFQTRSVDRGPTTPALAAFTSLLDAFQSGGIKEFTQRKGDLRSEVAKILKSDLENKERDRAENIALYLFPDLLGKHDFEREVAMDFWEPLEKQIEKSPNSKESRNHFEELKNNVWNYENPDRESPAVSEYASEVIRIYDALSQVE